MSRILLANVFFWASVCVAAGCNSSRYDQDAYDFDPEKSRTRAILNAQYAKGAAQDASLTPHHFDGTTLNGLGRDKLDRMLAYSKRDLVVHLDAVATPADEAQLMLASVRQYLKASGVGVTDETVVLGPSPRSANADGTLAGVKRLEQRDISGGTSTPGPAANQTQLGQ